MLHSVQAVTSKAKPLVFLFKQVTVRYPCVTNSESGYDSFLFTVDCFWFHFIEFVFGFTVPEFPPDSTNLIIYFRFEVQPTNT